MAETVQHFITAMDSLKLNMVAVDQVSLKSVGWYHLGNNALHITGYMSQKKLTASDGHQPNHMS